MSSKALQLQWHLTCVNSWTLILSGLVVDCVHCLGSAEKGAWRFYRAVSILHNFADTCTHGRSVSWRVDMHFGQTSGVQL